jgi:ketosteroid isomerase-like protein
MRTIPVHPLINRKGIVMKNLALAKTGYKKFADGDMDGVLALFDPKIEWHESKGFPFVEGEGVYRGPKAIADKIFSKIPEYYENFHIEVDEFIEAGDRIIMVGHYTGKWKSTGKSFKANAIHVWTVKKGKMTRFFQAVDTATIINPVKAAVY